MTTLPGNYWRILRSYDIEAAPFALLRGNADSEFNNRSHRKIMVIDGKIGYTGGVNIADEYINEVVKFGHWKDTGLRLEGEAVRELTRLFLLDYGPNVRREPDINQDYFPEYTADGRGWLIPFGDGPVPVYHHQVGKSVIQNMLNQAQRYVWMMTPYLIIDSELCMSIENTARRGVDVRIIVPHIPDKKLILEMPRSYYKNCSLGMKQRVGIAMALLGHPTLLVLDEPINGLDADGMRIMREVLTDITRAGECTVVISSHVLGELDKIATHYGIVRGGRMIREMTAAELDADCRTYVALRTKETSRAKALLSCKYSRVEEADEVLRVYDAASPEEIVTCLYENGILVSEISTDKIGLEEYYIDLMKEGK